MPGRSNEKHLCMTINGELLCQNICIGADLLCINMYAWVSCINIHAWEQKVMCTWEYSQQG